MDSNIQDSEFDALIRWALRSVWIGRPEPGAWERLVARLARQTGSGAAGDSGPAPATQTLRGTDAPNPAPPAPPPLTSGR